MSKKEEILNKINQLKEKMEKHEFQIEVMQNDLEKSKKIICELEEKCKEIF